MASLITLTSSDPGNPPVVLAPSHVVSVVPRKRMRPDMASQTNYVRTTFAGAKVSVVTGDYFNVEENHDVVCTLVDKALSSPTGLKLPTETGFKPRLAEESTSSQQPPQPGNPAVQSPAVKANRGKVTTPPVGDKPKVSEEIDED